MKMLYFLYLYVLLLSIKSTVPWTINNLDCSSYVSPNLIAEIESYRPVVNRIITEAVNGSFKDVTYKRLTDFIDEFGARFIGTRSLENAIDSILKQLTNEGFENVHGENVIVPRWNRGNESVTLIYPRKKNLAMLGLGNSIGTPKNGITAAAIVFDSFHDMETNFHLVDGKILVINENFKTYKESSIYTTALVSKASQYGAVGVLLSSATPFSLNTPHTGLQSYENNIKKIPVACITLADAHMLKRMQNRGQILQININMGARFLSDSVSRNVIADLKGRVIPDKFVIVSGHIDSWDVGQGVVDNGAGAFVSWNALALIKTLKLKPKRTMRTILWTGEEFGQLGSLAYFPTLDVQDIDFIMESNEGAFKPLGLRVSGIDETTCIVKEILQLLSPINATKLDVQDSLGSDISQWINIGVPGASLWVDDEKYFWYHHTEADTMDVVSSEDLNLCTATWAAVSYVIADLSIDIPREINMPKLEQKMTELKKSSGYAYFPEVIPKLFVFLQFINFLFLHTLKC